MKRKLILKIQKFNLENGIEINAEIFEYHRSIDKIIAKENVVVEDKVKNNKLFLTNYLF